MNTTQPTAKDWASVAGKFAGDTVLLEDELTRLRTELAALSKDVMPRSEFAELLEERDALRVWRDHCYEAWKERDALKADVAELNERLLNNAANMDLERTELKADVARLRSVVERCASGKVICSGMALAQEALAATAPEPVAT